MYADDTTIYFNLEDFDQNHMQTEINSELNKVNLWLKLNKLSLNTNKTKLMAFHRKQKQIKNINISIDNIQIERVHSFNFLGILLDETLSRKNHAIMIANKISRVTGILYRLKNLFPKETSLTLYNSLIESYINYGLLIWGKESHRVNVVNVAKESHTSSCHRYLSPVDVTYEYPNSWLFACISHEICYCSHIEEQTR